MSNIERTSLLPDNTKEELSSLLKEVELLKGNDIYSESVKVADRILSNDELALEQQLPYLKSLKNTVESNTNGSTDSKNRFGIYINAKIKDLVIEIEEVSNLIGDETFYDENIGSESIVDNQIEYTEIIDPKITEALEYVDQFDHYTTTEIGDFKCVNGDMCIELIKNNNLSYSVKVDTTWGDGINDSDVTEKLPLDPETNKPTERDILLAANRVKQKYQSLVA